MRTYKIFVSFVTILKKKELFLKRKVYTNVTHDDLSVLMIEFSFPCLR